MKYKCVDVGSEKCPCVLMEAGECYTCNMSKYGKCDGDCLSGWQGVCPYTEYIQNGKKAKENIGTYLMQILEIKEYSNSLKRVRLWADSGFAQKSKNVGAYIMVKSLGYNVPLSVLNTCTKDGEGNSYIEVLIQEAGAKTKNLFKENSSDEIMVCGRHFWEVTGPYFGGLLYEKPIDFSKRTLVVAKGTAISPYINIREKFQNIQKNSHVAKVKLLIDDTKLTEEFLEEYVPELNESANTEFAEGNSKTECLKINLARENAVEMLIDEAKNFAQIIFLASPYYTQKFKEALSESQENKSKNLITPNHANLCCGLGICGSCSFTDEDGVTVKKCKCVEGE